MSTKITDADMMDFIESAWRKHPHHAPRIACSTYAVLRPDVDGYRTVRAAIRAAIRDERSSAGKSNK